MDPIKTFFSDVVPGLTVEKLNTLQRRIPKEKLQQQQKVVAAPEAADIGI